MADDILLCVINVVTKKLNAIQKKMQLKHGIGELLMADIDLNSCPFCGSNKIDVRYMIFRPYIICTKCHAQIPCYNSFRDAVNAWNRRVDLENRSFEYICKSNDDYYPTEFSIYARVISKTDKDITIDRFMKYGAVHVGGVTITLKDFKRYYEKLEY